MMIPKRSCQILRPEYSRTNVPQYRENPLIRALGPILPSDETLEKLTRRPSYNVELRNLPAEERIHCIPGLTEMVLPLSANARFERMFSVMVRQGYVGRNPLSLDFHQRNKRLAEITEEAKKATVSETFIGSPTGALVTGISGLGKTSMIATSLDLIPNGTIVHDSFEGQKLNCTQIPAVVVECTNDASSKGLILAVLNELSRLANEDLHRGLKGGTKTELVPHVVQHLINYHVGIVAIDEAEYVTAQFSGGDSAMLYFWINMMNCTGVPLLLIANPEFEQITDKWLKAGMRFCNGGHIRMRPLPRKGEWEALMHGAWEYQYTKTPTPLSNALLSKMYHYSQGIVKLSLLLYNFAQATAILKGGDELITPAIIDQAFQENALSVEYLIEGIRNNDAKVFAFAKDLGKRKSASEFNGSTGDQTVPAQRQSHPSIPAKKLKAKMPPAPKPGKVPPSGLLSFLQREVRGDFSVLAALREHDHVRPAMEFWVA